MAQRDTLRLRNYRLRRHYYVFGVSAVASEAEFASGAPHLLPGAVGRCLFNYSGEIAPGSAGQSCHITKHSLHVLDVGRGDRGGVNSDQDLVPARLRNGNIFKAQVLDAKFMKPQCAHGVLMQLYVVPMRVIQHLQSTYGPHTWV